MKEKSNEDVFRIQSSWGTFFCVQLFDYTKMLISDKLKAIPGTDTLVYMSIELFLKAYFFLA